MRTDEILMLVLHECDSKMVTGRTLLQKTIYFLNEKNNFGIEFKPHYYGPYSSEVADAAESLKESGIIKEFVVEIPTFDTQGGFEAKRYTYTLTEIGTEIAKNLEKKHFDTAEKIKDQLYSMEKLDGIYNYNNLSIAAKMYHILKIEKKNMTIDEIHEEAKALGWNVGMVESEKAINFLKDLKLVN